ncbi:hypothetical protein BKA70DRAFT_1250146 [Coprinopsis sp. MPI-PUGE-AT-0042]|nr:hypothetical protein BKA70DRAFT_1250146 [Coprinopsis sp. MPI-PUGE-AT-0042]
MVSSRDLYLAMCHFWMSVPNLNQSNNRLLLQQSHITGVFLAASLPRLGLMVFRGIIWTLVPGSTLGASETFVPPSVELAFIRAVVIRGLFCRLGRLSVLTTFRQALGQDRHYRLRCYANSGGYICTFNRPFYPLPTLVAPCRKRNTLIFISGLASVCSFISSLLVLSRERNKAREAIDFALHLRPCVTIGRNICTPEILRGRYPKAFHKR